MDAPRDDGADVISLSERLERLFRARTNPRTGRPFTLPEVEAGIHAQAEGLPDEERRRRQIGRTYIWQLRKGERTNPTVLHLRSLAEFFGVPVGYFVDDIRSSDELDRRLTLAGAVDDSDVRDIALRAAGADARTRRLVRDMLDHSRALSNGSPPDGGGEVPGRA
jgi:transcriptional regulator with XRE-family HTH domain